MTISLANIIQRTANGAAPGTAETTVFNPSGSIVATDVQAALVELDSEKQTALVSGTNIKTINGTSLLGSGDFTVSVSESILETVADATTVTIASGYQQVVAESYSVEGTLIIEGKLILI